LLCVDVGGGHLVREAGMSKLGGGPGLHNKPLGCGASEVYASGPACEEEEEETSNFIKTHISFYVCLE